MIYDKLDETVAKAMEEHNVPGAVVGVLHEAEAYTSGLGITNVDHPLQVTEGTLFQIGSITKTFTATAIVRLAVQGKVDLDAPIRAYIPDFRVRDQDASARATLRHVLTHTAGWIGDFFLDTGAGDDALSKFITAMAELQQLAPLGLHYSYNNAGFQLIFRSICRHYGGIGSLIRTRSS
jgi:CubicO group peptidase (beta-lactamase class C family)